MRVLVDRHAEAGPHETAWSGETFGGGRVASGVYFVRLRVDGRNVDSPRRLAFVR